MQEVVALFGSFNAPLLALVLPPIIAIKLGVGGKGAFCLHVFIAVSSLGLALGGVIEAAYNIYEDYLAR